MAAAKFNRFASLGRSQARLVLALVAVLFLWFATTPVERHLTARAADGTAISAAAANQRDNDLTLYDRVIERIRGGAYYYGVIAEEQRRANFPMRPALAVRLPTLAYVDAWLGDRGQPVAAALLLAAVCLAWWRRLGQETAGGSQRLMAMALLLLGGATLGMTRYYFVLHELWAGMLLALSFGLHRPGRWLASLAVAALALAIREHALPFVLLMAALALWRRDWKEGAAWCGLALLFLAGLAAHVHTINAMLLPGDRPSAPWLVLRGLGGLVSDYSLASNVRLLPAFLAGPLIFFSLLGWVSWRSQAGTFGALLYLGYGLLFMLAGRVDNWYWGFMVTPAFFIGLAFAPRGLTSLLTKSLAK